MSIIFPSNPTIGEIFTYQGRSWEWNGDYWESYSYPSSSISGVTSVGFGDSVINGVVDNVLALKSFSGDGVSIIDDGVTLTISASTSPGGSVTSVSGGTGLSGNSTTGNVVLINTSPDQTVTITGGTNIQINGSYPNFGIDFTGQTSFPYLPLSGGTVTGNTTFQSGLTANTISATTYNNLPISGITNGTGITSTTSNGVVTITNTAPNQVITISGGTGITTGGTYPNFTITNSAPNQVVTISGGTGITTGGTYPNFTITNSAPDQTVVINNGYLTESSGTYPTFEVNYAGPTLLASGSVYIIPDGSYYGGSANDGWAGHYWDDYQSTLPFNRAWYGIPIPIEFRFGHYIKVCGVGYTDSSVPESENLDVDIRYYDCADFRTTRLGVSGFSFDKDGISCFTLLVENTSITLPENTSFIYLAFRSSNTAMDATITKITYNLSICPVSF